MDAGDEGLFEESGGRHGKKFSGWRGMFRFKLSVSREHRNPGSLLETEH
jgi:hypothetical protein